MNKKVTEKWNALDGKLVFDLTIVRNADNNQPSKARIYYKESPRECNTVDIYENTHSHFNYRFTSGYYAHGYLYLRKHQHVNGVSHIGVFGNIHFGHATFYDEQHFEGFMVVIDTDGRPYPPPDPGPEPIPSTPTVLTPSNNLAIISPPHSELFPYVYVRKWPSISAEDLQSNFIQYIENANTSPPPSSFYADLCLARKNPIGARESMQDLAISFIEGQPPYQGQFVSGINVLSSPVAMLPMVYQLLLKTETNTTELLLSILALLNPNANIGTNTTIDPETILLEILTSPQYLGEIDRIWQSYFALIIIAGYDRLLLSKFVDILITSHELNYLYVDPGLTKHTDAALLHALSHASIALPQTIFPLPPSTFSPPVDALNNEAQGWIEPYAIGDLQMVRQRLVRYAPGEIAYIENIMKGEKKEISRKRTHRQVDYEKNEIINTDDLSNDASDGRSNFLEEIRQAIAEKVVTNKYKDFTTTYGPPTEATLNGSWAEYTQQGKLPGSDDVTRFAKEILNKTVSKITRNVSSNRGSSTLNETEDAVKSTIDNSAGDINQITVFRWLNKIYEAHVVNYGNRLMIEFMLRSPAQEFINETHALTGTDYCKPVAPKTIGITSFASIEPNNYGQLAAAYDVSDITPPPETQITVSTTLRSSEEKLLAIPTGYRASNAYVSSIEATGGTAAPIVMVGREIFNPGDSPAQARVFGEDIAIPIAVVGYLYAFSPPSTTDALVNVIVVCTPKETTMDAWRIRIYNAILLGYQKQVAAFYSGAGLHAGRRGPARSQLATQSIERGQLQRGCMRLLLDRFSTLTGAPDFVTANPCPTDLSVNEPRYLQFFEELFEWNEISYRYYVNVSSTGKKTQHDILGAEASEPLSAFLEADMARVMVPAQAQRVMALVYFLSTGMLWDGDNRQAPVCTADISLVNDLKSVLLKKSAHGNLVGDPWNVVVPTSMQIIDSALQPTFYAE